MRLRRPLFPALLLAFVGSFTGLVLSSHARANNWPPPAGADMTDKNNWPNDPGYAGQWNYFSWLPKQEANTQPYLSADQKLGASGMSVDKAWTYSIGRPDVHIAVIDSGIEWEQPDIVNKVALNGGELGGTKRPQDKHGAPCPALNGAFGGYDCNGDGIFSVADYRDDPRIAPVVTGQKCPGTQTDEIQGDKNRNCILDAGDLIELFSDGTDDDANGYTDDIAGWDFYKNDNNPYDDTRYGHGTGEAKDSSAEGNNNLDSIGTCPMCRFIPLRVGDSFIADANDFAKAVVYATDNGVKVVQEALGTVDMTAFAKAAIDYAYGKGVIVVASMADENARHHNMPGAYLHTLPVHAITYNGPSATSSTSFLSFNTCTNFGGQMALSVSGKSCSSEAAGRSSGIAGLLFSFAASQTQPIQLTAEEVMQLLKMSADDIDVPESRAANASDAQQFYESKPGWDQRFGYGRVNVARAMELIANGTIPPEVDVTSPGWFDVFYADRSGGPIAIAGRVAASRASSYDYRVEWAPGVEPDDAQFQVIAKVDNVPSGTVSGGAMPLAQIDPSQIDTTHTPDPDSPRHENDRTITIRVHATAHYADKAVGGEARRTIAIVNQKNGLDADLLPGFPIKLGGSIEAAPKMADIDGDGLRDIVVMVSDGSLHVYSMKTGQPVLVPGFPVRTNLLDGVDPSLSDPNVPSYVSAPAYKSGASGGIDPQIAREASIAAPAIADIDGDGKPEIVMSTWSGTEYVVNAAGQALPGWPKRLPLVPSCPLDPTKPKPQAPCMDTQHGFARGAASSPVIADIDKDGKPDIIQSAFDGRIYAFHADGSAVAGFPVLIHTDKTPKYNRIMTTPVVGDFNGDGVLDLATGSNEEVGGGGGTGPAFAVDGRGMGAPKGPFLPNWPITLTSLHLFPVVGEGIDASPVAADFNGDGKPDILLQGNGAGPTLMPGDPGVQSAFDDPPNKLPVIEQPDGTVQRGFDPTSIFGELTKAMQPDTMFPALSQPAIGDLDQDGVPDVVMSGGSLTLAGNLAGGSSARPFQHLLAMWSGKTGHMMPGSPFVLEDYTFFASSAIADITGDDYPEVMIGTGGYFVRALDACGREASGWPKFTNGWVTGTPAVGDVDGDRKLEVAVGTREGYLFAWKTNGTVDGVIQWESFHHDNANTGNFATKLDQGVVKRAAAPLRCAAPAPPEAPSYDAGGCAMTGTSNEDGALAWLAALVAVAAGKLRRRR